VLVENLFEIFTRDATYAQDIVDHASGEKNRHLELVEREELDDTMRVLSFTAMHSKIGESTNQRCS